MKPLATTLARRTGASALLVSCLLLLGLLVQPAQPARADEAASATPLAPRMETLTLEQALAMALEQNKDIAKAQEYRKLVEGRYVEERSAALPHLTGSAGALRDRDESQRALTRGQMPDQKDTTQAAITLNQALYTWGQIGAAIKGAQVGLLTADDQLRLYRQAVRRDVTAAFYDILLAKELLAIARQNHQQRARHLDEAQRKFEAGTATDYDVLASQVALSNAQPEVIRGENQVRTARERLGLLLGRQGRQLDVKGSLAADITSYPGYDEPLEQALKHRPELMDLRHRQEMAGYLVEVYDAGDKPRVDLQASYGQRNIDVYYTSDEGTTGMAGVFVTWPIFDGLKTRGKVSQARSDHQRLKIEEAQLKDNIGLQVTEAVNKVEESGEIVKGLSDTVHQARRLLFMAEKGFEYGVKTRLEVDDALLNLSQAQGNLARAQRDYLVAKVTLVWVTGTLGEEPGRQDREQAPYPTPWW
ncbi:MAG: TolC family protein [Pseudomonadota bacterium]